MFIGRAPFGGRTGENDRSFLGENMAAGRVLNCYDTHLRDGAENIYRPVIVFERRIGRAWNRLRLVAPDG